MPYYIVFIVTFGISFAAVPLVIQLANDRGIIAYPGRRHIHTEPTPKFGGVAIAASVLLASPFVFSLEKTVGSYLAACALILILGIIDDVRGTTWKIKLLFSITATMIVVLGTGVYFENLGNLIGLGEVHLSLWGIPFTLFSFFGIMNSINLIDGLNGLASGVSSIAFLAFAVFAAASGNSTVLYLSLANLGATIGFFKYNFPGARIFMGDSGSMFLGFSLAVMAMLLTQGKGSIDPMVPVVVLGIPMFDAVRILVIRIRNGKHPFRADKTHLHHLILRSGISQQRVVLILWMLSALMASLAFVLYRFESWLMVCVFFIIIAIISVFIENLKIVKLSSSINGNGSKEEAPEQQN
jgi:UDP-GlcNAc:undecaprenyl-phosphate GlcNAc-1-phosphate transferase